MEQVTITKDVSDILIFNGEVLFTFDWKMAYITYSGSCTAYKTESNNIVITTSEWIDEGPLSGNKEIRYAIITAETIVKLRNRSKWSEFFNSTKGIVIRLITPGFPFLKTEIINRAATMLLSHLNMGPPITKVIQ